MPVVPSSVHLPFTGLMGIMLGLGIFPAVLVALALQAILFGFGGLTTLEINAVNIALPGAIPSLILGPPYAGPVVPRMAVLLSGPVDVLSVLATGGLPSLSLWLSASAHVPVAKMLFAAYLPLAGAEAAIAAVIAGFIFRVQPAALRPYRAPMAE